MVIFVVLHYMVFKETKQCVNSIKNNVKGEKKIIIVDNYSPNDSYSSLVDAFGCDKDIIIMKSDSNLGFARGNNLGYKYAVENFNPDFIVVMNNDMEIFQEDFIDKLYESYAKYGYYILGPDIYSTKQEYHQNPQTRKVLDRSDLKLLYRKLVIKDRLRFLVPVKWWFKNILIKNKSVDNNSKDKNEYVQNIVKNPLLHGSCYVFSKKFIEKHQYTCFYDKTFMYMEAEILHYMALKNNELMLYYPDLKVYHHEDVATDSTFVKQYKKSFFTIRCLLQSTKAFIDLIDSDKKE